MRGMAMGGETKKEDERDDLAETKRIMERLVRTPPKPHKSDAGNRGPGKRKPTSDNNSDDTRDR